MGTFEREVGTDDRGGEPERTTVILWSKPVEDLIARNHKLCRATEQRGKPSCEKLFGKISKFSVSPCLIVTKICNGYDCGVPKSPVADKDQQHMETEWWDNQEREGQVTDDRAPPNVQPIRLLGLEKKKDLL